jgi:hypothetical protein
MSKSISARGGPPDPRRISRLHAIVVKRCEDKSTSCGLSEAQLSDRLELALNDYRSLSGEARDDNSAEALLIDYEVIASAVREIESIAQSMPILRQTTYHGMRLAFIPDEALTLLRQAGAAYLEHLRECKRMPRWSDRREETAANELLYDIADIWRDATGTDATFTTRVNTRSPTSKSKSKLKGVTGRFVDCYLEATRGLPDLPKTGAALKSAAKRATRFKLSRK